MTSKLKLLLLFYSKTIYTCIFLYKSMLTRYNKYILKKEIKEN